VFRISSNSFESVCSIPIGLRKILWDGVSRFTTLPHHRGTPARRAMLPSMPVPRLDPEAGLARGCGEGTHPVLSSKSSEFIECPENR
jgi:hypothetical protein